MEKQTAIQKCLADWLENREAKKTDILNTIKELEKLEEIKPFNYSQWEVEMANLRRLREWKGCIDWFITSLEYHESTYGSKGSDSEIPNLSEMPTSSQTEVNETHNSPKEENKDSFGEISDEEITKLANEHILYNDSKRQWVIEGMKLYREHLKINN